MLSEISSFEQSTSFPTAGSSHEYFISSHALSSVSSDSSHLWVFLLSVDISSAEQVTVAPFTGSSHEYICSLHALVVPSVVSATHLWVFLLLSEISRLEHSTSSSFDGSPQEYFISSHFYLYLSHLFENIYGFLH